jgi:hypothetical protein
MRRVVHLAGRNVELSAADEWRWDAVEALFAGCADSSSQIPDVRLRFDQVPPTLPDRPPTLTYTGIDVWLGGDGAACRSTAGVAARRHGDDIVVGGPAHGSPTSDPALDPGGDPAFDLATAFRRSVQHVLADALAEQDRYALHAASIRSGSDVVVALGGTGAGKSTLAYAASQRGWSVLTDDLTFILSGIEGVLAWGLRKRLNIPRDLVAGDDHGDASRPWIAIPNDARNRLQLPLEHDDVPDAGRVVAVVLVEHAAGAGHLERIEPGPSLLKSLLPSFPLAPDRSRMRELFPSAAALSRLPAWRLYHDADPHRRLDVAGTLLASITRTFDLDDESRGSGNDQ